VIFDAPHPIHALGLGRTCGGLLAVGMGGYVYSIPTDVDEIAPQLRVAVGREPTPHERTRFGINGEFRIHLGRETSR
jgi:hypothetical protein